MTVVLAARELDAGYSSQAVVRRLDLEVHAGEMVALLGPNGAGKSTTILTLAGELPVLGGSVELFGRTTRQPLHLRARAGLGLVTEERAVLMNMTVAQNLRVNRGDRELALDLFPELDAHLDRRVGLLSGGQQQILALARVLSRRPKVVLADELSLGLAPMVVDRLLAALRDAADSGVGVLVVEQLVHRALAVSDRAYVLRHGEITMSGASDDLRSRIDDVQKSYLGSMDPAPIADRDPRRRGASSPSLPQ